MVNDEGKQIGMLRLLVNILLKKEIMKVGSEASERMMLFLIKMLHIRK